MIVMRNGDRLTCEINPQRRSTFSLWRGVRVNGLKVERLKVEVLSYRGGHGSEPPFLASIFLKDVGLGTI